MLDAREDNPITHQGQPSPRRDRDTDCESEQKAQVQGSRCTGRSRAAPIRLEWPNAEPERSLRRNLAASPLPPPHLESSPAAASQARRSNSPGTLQPSITLPVDSDAAAGTTASPLASPRPEPPPLKTVFALGRHAELSVQD